MKNKSNQLTSSPLNYGFSSPLSTRLRSVLGTYPPLKEILRSNSAVSSLRKFSLLLSFFSVSWTASSDGLLDLLTFIYPYLYYFWPLLYLAFYAFYVSIYLCFNLLLGILSAISLAAFMAFTLC